MTLPGPECEPMFGFPARVRSAFSGPDLQTGVIADVVTVVDAVAMHEPQRIVPDFGPSAPPRHAPIPLRI